MVPLGNAPVSNGNLLSLVVEGCGGGGGGGIAGGGFGGSRLGGLFSGRRFGGGGGLLGRGGTLGSRDPRRVAQTFLGELLETRQEDSFSLTRREAHCGLIDERKRHC